MTLSMITGVAIGAALATALLGNAATSIAMVIAVGAAFGYFIMRKP